MEYTSPWMNAELEGFRDAVRRFVDTEIVPNQEHWRKQQHVDRTVWDKGGEMGILLADIPEEYGGSGGSFAHQSVVFEELGYAGDMAFGIHVHAIVAHYILNQGTEEQKLKYLPKLASGEMVLAHVPSHHDHQVGEWIGIRAEVDHVVTFARERA